MDQRSIVVFLRLKGLSAKAKNVDTELVEVLRSDAIAYLTVTNHIRNNLIFQNELEAENRAEDQGFLITDNAILKAFEMITFGFIHQIAKMTFLPPALLFHRLTELLHIVLRRLPGVPQTLGFSKTGSGPLPKELLELLQSLRDHSQKCRVALDEG
jgi:hypothetical protein